MQQSAKKTANVSKTGKNVWAVIIAFVLIVIAVIVGLFVYSSTAKVAEKGNLQALYEACKATQEKNAKIEKQVDADIQQCSLTGNETCETDRDSKLLVLGYKPGEGIVCIQPK